MELNAYCEIKFLFKLALAKCILTSEGTEKFLCMQM